MSGHSRWATIERTEGAADAKRGRVWTEVIEEVADDVQEVFGEADLSGAPLASLS